MKENFCKKNYTADFMENGYPQKTVALAEIHFFQGQAPYFSLTGRTCEVGGNKGGAWGCIHDDIIFSFPELARFVRWHLTSLDRPFNYISNSLYHAGFLEYTNQQIDLVALKKVCVYGALKSDYDFDLLSADKMGLINWLIERLPSLMSLFYSDMKDLFQEQFIIAINDYKGA